MRLLLRLTHRTSFGAAVVRPVSGEVAPLCEGFPTILTGETSALGRSFLFVPRCFVIIGRVKTRKRKKHKVKMSHFYNTVF